MRTLISICLCYFIISNPGLIAQNNSTILENTSDQKVFQMNVDTITKYLYLDTDIVDQYFESCKNILERDILLPDSILFDYVIQEIYYAHIKENALAAYQLITDHEYLLSAEEIPQNLKNTFIYIRGFTQMELGDLEFAQKAFYEMIDNGEKQGDTSQIVQGLFSLGQLLSDEKDLDGAIECFNRLLSFSDAHIKPGTFSLINFELSEAYQRDDQLEKALELVDSTLLFLEQHKLYVLKPDFLLLKGEIALQQENYELAREIYGQANVLAKRNRDPTSVHKSEMFKAKTLSNEGNYSAAIKIYESLIEQQDTGDIVQALKLYTEVHPVYKKNGEDTKAYYYFYLSDSIQNRLDTEKEWQQSDYLKIKHENEKQENENKILAVQVAQKISQNRLLYALTALFGLGILILFGAFYQKRKFNQKLKAEVSSRTSELKHANAHLVSTNHELDEFNRILSHDLKEPIRSLVGFSTLLKKKGIQEQEAKEYLGFIEQSGKQLYETLAAVSAFQNTAPRGVLNYEEIDISQLVEATFMELKRKAPERQIKYAGIDLPTIRSYRPAIQTIFTELIGNAVKFNQSPMPEIKIKYYTKDGSHFFEFQDNGIGMAPAFHEQIFRMFKRLNGRDKYRGAGLGLNIAIKMARRLNGDISILKSEEDKGSTFLFNFPVDF